MTIPPDQVPLRDSNLNLDISGVAGFFGGDVAISAMATLHIYRGRKWLGWYNSPGSFEIAKRYGQLIQSRLWAGLYPGARPQAPAVLFDLDGRVGPKYRAAFWEKHMEKTGHLANLFFDHCRRIPLAKDMSFRAFEGRVTIPTPVVIAELNKPQDAHAMDAYWASISPDYKVPTLSLALLSLIPISASVATCVACAIAGERLVASMIALGILANGLSCLAIGGGYLTFTQLIGTRSGPPETGTLYDNSQIVIVRGATSTIATITDGRFSLEYGDGTMMTIGLSSILLTCQFITQLLVVPQGRIFGQVMFLGSLAVSWGYNTYLSSIDRMSLQRQILVEKFLKQPKMHKVLLGTRTTTVVFALLVLSGFADEPVEPTKFRAILDHWSPNNSPAWQSWKNVIVNTLVKNTPGDFERPDVPPFERNTDCEVPERDKYLLDVIYQDAETARRMYLEYCKMRRFEEERTQCEGNNQTV